MAAFPRLPHITWIDLSLEAETNKILTTPSFLKLYLPMALAAQHPSGCLSALRILLLPSSFCLLKRVFPRLSLWALLSVRVM